MSGVIVIVAHNPKPGKESDLWSWSGDASRFCAAKDS